MISTADEATRRHSVWYADVGYPIGKPTAIEHLLNSQDKHTQHISGAGDKASQSIDAETKPCVDGQPDKPSHGKL